MTVKDNGGPAFPVNNNDVITIVTNNGNHPEGMSLRDYFAAKAMMGMSASPGFNDYNLSKIAELSYKQADEMLKAREEK